MTVVQSQEKIPGEGIVPQAAAGKSAGLGQIAGQGTSLLDTNRHGLHHGMADYGVIEAFKFEIS